MTDPHQRIDELEIRYTHQEQLVEELNLVVAECHQRIARLERELQTYREMLRDAENTDLPGSRPDLGQR